LPTPRCAVAVWCGCGAGDLVHGDGE